MRFASLNALLALAAMGLSAQTIPLELGKSIADDLTGPQIRDYSLRLDVNQYLRAVVTQSVSVASIQILAPDGKELQKLDSPDFPGMPSRIVWIAQTAGEYRIRVNVPRVAASHYEVKLVELRPATARDRRTLEAHRLFAQGLVQAHNNSVDQAALSYTRALAIDREAGDREGEGDALGAMGALHSATGQFPKAIIDFQQAVTIFRGIKHRPSELLCLSKLGVAYERTGQYQKAIELQQQVLMISRDVGDPRAEGVALKDIGNVYSGLSETTKAITYYEQALAIAHKIGDHNVEGRVLSNLGNARASLADYPEAINYYEQALVMSRETGDRQAEGFSLYNLSAVFGSLGQIDKAIDYDQQAMTIAREIKDRFSQARITNALGWNNTLLGRDQEAIEYYKQALAVERELKDRAGEGTTLINIGTTYGNLGEYRSSIGYYEQALVVTRAIKERWGEGTALENLGWAYSSLKQYSKAISYNEQALAIDREVKNRQGEGGVLNDLGVVWWSLQQYEKAASYQEQALAIAREIKDRTGETHALNDLGRCWLSLKQYAKAISFHQQALTTAREIKDRSGEAGGLSGMMNVSQASEQPRLAIFYGKQAVNTLQSMRSDIHGLTQDVQQSFLKDNEKPYHSLAEILIADGRLAEAEQVLALLKEAEYFQFIRGDLGEAPSLSRRAELTPEETEYEKRYREIGDNLMTIGVERGGLLAKKSLTPEQSQRLAALEQDLIVGNQAFERFLGDLTQHFSAKPEMTGRIENLRETQGIMEDLRELPAGTVAIFTLIGDDKFHTILRTPDAQKAYEYPIKAADLNRKILEFRQSIQNPKLDPRPLAQELYKILIADMADDLRQADAKTLMWSLDGALRYIPLAALCDGKHYLVEQYGVSVMTLASNTRLKDRPDRTWTAAGFGTTAALPSVASELGGIISTKPGDGGVLAGEIKLDAQFTQQSMRETLLKHYPVVHIASHFNFQAGNETKSYLLLGDGGHLSLAQLKTSANLFGGVQLLTLSACNTGVGDGAEVEAFGALAQRQGAKAVVASLWPVVDASTALLMRELYRIREANPSLTKLEALRQAQIELLQGKITSPSEGRRRALIHETAAPSPSAQDFRHPYFWAPFFLMGNWL